MARISHQFNIFFIDPMGVIDISFLNPDLRQEHKDTETGCIYFGGNKDSVYEACRQSFYLKQQNEILKQNSQQQQATTPVSSEQKIKDLESRNIDFQKITDQQNQQITQLIQNVEKTARKIESLNLINTILIIVLVVVVCVFYGIKLKSGSKKNRIHPNHPL